MIEAAAYLGLIEIEAQDPESRAYRLAHQGFEVLKTELVGTPLELMSDQSVRKRGLDGRSVLLEVRDATVVRQHDDGTTELILDLGPGGGLRFRRFGKQGLEVIIQARAKDGGAYDVNLIIPANQGDGPTERRGPLRTR